jgi:hypothetical protein
MAKQISRLFSDTHQLSEIAKLIENYGRLPFSPISVPGGVLEGVFGYIRRAEVLRTYDFVDVIDRKARLGWQIKSTLAGTPVTWKRAKIRDRGRLIQLSEHSPEGLQKLGDAIIDFCNDHARKSLERYDLSEIGYGHLVVHKNLEATYFERLLCTQSEPTVFNSHDFVWSWSEQKKTNGKEQLSALHGVHKSTKKKWFAWHGRGENQLHFSGESSWWPGKGNINTISFRLPDMKHRLSILQFVDLLACADNPLPKVE